MKGNEPETEEDQLLRRVRSRCRSGARGAGQELHRGRSGLHRGDGPERGWQMPPMQEPPMPKGCPVDVPIPEFIECILKGKYAEGIAVIKSKNSLPAVCGRVCPQEEQCQKRCVMGKKGEPISIGRLERFLADWEREWGAYAGEGPRPARRSR